MVGTPVKSKGSARSAARKDGAGRGTGPVPVIPERSGHVPISAMQPPTMLPFLAGQAAQVAVPVVQYPAQVTGMQVVHVPAGPLPEQMVPQYGPLPVAPSYQEGVVGAAQFVEIPVAPVQVLNQYGSVPVAPYPEEAVQMVEVPPVPEQVVHQQYGPIPTAYFPEHTGQQVLQPDVVSGLPGQLEQQHVMPVVGQIQVPSGPSIVPVVPPGAPVVPLVPPVPPVVPLLPSAVSLVPPEAIVAPSVSEIPGCGVLSTEYVSGAPPGIGQPAVTEISLQLTVPTIAVPIATYKKSQKRPRKSKQRAQGEKEAKPMHEVIIVGEGTVMSVMVAGRKGEWKPPKCKSWPRARKHRREKFPVRYQAEQIEQLFLNASNDTDTAPTVLCLNEKLLPSFDILPENVLVKIFKLVGYEKNGSPNRSVYNMYRLELVCKRFWDVLEKNAKVLPLFRVLGIRIRAIEMNPDLCSVLVYRYGTGAFEFPCLCIDLEDLPVYLRHDRISAFIFVDSMRINDELLLKLMDLNYTRDVRKIIFSNIDAVCLNSKHVVSIFLDKFRGLQELQFFGYYDESELCLRYSSVVGQMRRSERDNGEMRQSQLKEMTMRYRFKHRRRTERARRRACKKRELALRGNLSPVAQLEQCRLLTLMDYTAVMTCVSL